MKKPVVAKQSIVVGLVTYNTSNADLARYCKSLKNAVEVFRRETGNELNVKLNYIDNGKPSGLKKIFPGAVECKSLGNIGYSRAINILIKKAFEDPDCSHFLSSNPDGAFDPYFFVEMISFAKKFPRDLIEGLQFPEEHPKLYDRKSYVTDWASGCATLYSRELIDEVGYMDPNFFMYVEDVDYSWRVRIAGRKIRVCPKALYGHWVVNRKPSKLTTKFFYESGRYLAIKWKNKEFQNLCETALIENGVYASKKELTKYKINSEKSGLKKSQHVVNFQTQFHFSKVRWV